jgi:hypothetical protein
MTPRLRVTSPIPHPARILAWHRDDRERDRRLHDGAGRQREIRQRQAARRDDDDGDAA